MVLLVLTLASNLCIAWTNSNYIELNHSAIVKVDIFDASTLDDRLADVLFPVIYKEIKLSEAIVVDVQCQH